MADPSYIDSDGVLTDGEAWVAISSTTPAGANLMTLTSTDDGQVGDWSQYLDLIIIGYVCSDEDYNPSRIKGSINGDGASTYSWESQDVITDGNTYINAATTYDANFYAGYTASTDSGVSPDASGFFSTHIIEFFDINSAKYKTVNCLNALDWGDGGRVYYVSNTFMKQLPISRIDLHVDAAGGSWEFDTGTRFDLFGILPRMVA